MVLNLSKTFNFDRDQKEYHVDYIFRKDVTDNAPGELCMELNVSVNAAEKQVHRISKTTDTLYQSNEAIEKMIEEETVSLYQS